MTSSAPLLRGHVEHAVHRAIDREPESLRRRTPPLSQRNQPLAPLYLTDRPDRRLLDRRQSCARSRRHVPSHLSQRHRWIGGVAHTCSAQAHTAEQRWHSSARSRLSGACGTHRSRLQDVLCESATWYYRPARRPLRMASTNLRPWHKFAIVEQEPLHLLHTRYRLRSGSIYNRYKRSIAVSSSLRR